MTLPDFLTEDPNGFIHVTGHRIGLMHIVDLYRDERYTPELLEDHFPTLSLANIHKVIAFYLDNKAEVDAYCKAEREGIDRQMAQPNKGPSSQELQRRMEARRKAQSA